VDRDRVFRIHDTNWVESEEKFITTDSDGLPDFVIPEDDLLVFWDSDEQTWQVWEGKVNNFMIRNNAKKP